MRQSQSNDVLNNEITKNTICGVSDIETASNEIKYNLIIENQIGVIAVMASDFKLNYNDIFLNSLVGLFTFNGFGSATNNYWGSAWGPIPLVGIFRIIPPFPPVRPWSIVPNID